LVGYKDVKADWLAAELCRLIGWPQRCEGRLVGRRVVQADWLATKM
jgi:hypothetical protein